MVASTSNKENVYNRKASGKNQGIPQAIKQVLSSINMEKVVYQMQKKKQQFILYTLSIRLVVR
jgi:hypothetical protein